jgi:uncharacterized Zn finger protein (UPF0148 family)
MNETYECPKCGASLTLPSEIDGKTKAEVVDACRWDRKIEAMAFIMKKLNVGLGDSKSILWHISGPNGHCGRCGHALLESGITYCPFCNSLNLNW